MFQFPHTGKIQAMELETTWIEEGFQFPHTGKIQRIEWQMVEGNPVSIPTHG